MSIALCHYVGERDGGRESCTCRSSAAPATTPHISAPHFCTTCFGKAAEARKMFKRASQFFVNTRVAGRTVSVSALFKNA